MCLDLHSDSCWVWLGDLLTSTVFSEVKHIIGRQRKVTSNQVSQREDRVLC